MLKRRLPENFIFLFKFLIMVQIFVCSSFLSRNNKTYHKNHSKSKLKSSFSRIFTKTNNASCCWCKTVEFSIFLHYFCFMIVLNARERILSYKKFDALKFEGDWGKVLGKICFFRQSSAKYIWKGRKIKQNWARPDNFNICFYLS